jgi:tetratricopeptide (TPR) repeat protein
VPIPAQSRPPSPAAIHANRSGAELRAQGKLTEAAAAFERGIVAQGELPELHLNLGATLVDLGRLEEARDRYAHVLELDHENESAHLAMYELQQALGKREDALVHQQRVLARRTLFSAYAPGERRRILVLMAPGDWQANVPIDYLADPQTTTLHKLYLTSYAQAQSATLPKADTVFTAIAESPENLERLKWAHDVCRRSGLPVINDPRKVLSTNRAAVPRLLSGIANVRVPATLEVAHEELARGRVPFAYPLVVRPVGSQAGRDLQKIDDAAALKEYAHRTAAPSYFVQPFVDYSGPDGFFRKYRIFVVDGVPMPCHMAVSSNWMIHYYNAPMREHAWMREEERRVLGDFEHVFPARLQTALREVWRAMELDYIGADCAIDRDGHLLIFEIDPAMIVHAADEPELFAYKHDAARRIFEAFTAMVDRARSR